MLESLNYVPSKPRKDRKLSVVFRQGNGLQVRQTGSQRQTGTQGCPWSQACINNPLCAALRWRELPGCRQRWQQCVYRISGRHSHAVSTLCAAVCAGTCADQLTAPHMQLGATGSL